MKHLVLGIVALIAFGAPVRAEIAIQEVSTPSGITAWLVEEHSLPFTALEIRFRGGTSLDRQGGIGRLSALVPCLKKARRIWMHVALQKPAKALPPLSGSTPMVTR